MLKKTLLTNNCKIKINLGFTILELLVVISIIALLSTIVFAGIQNARQRGRDAAMLGVMGDIYKEAVICLDRGYTLIAPTSATNGGGTVCSVSNLTYLPVPIGSNWQYDRNNFLSETVGGRFYIRAIYPANATAATGSITSTSTTPGALSGATKNIYCENVEGCKKSGF